MRTIKIYFKRAPFYNAFIGTNPTGGNCRGIERCDVSLNPGTSDCLTVLPTIANFISASFFLAWLIVVIHYRAWINLTGIWLQSDENAISNGLVGSDHACFRLK
jgi:hypothetical protein